MEIVTDRVTLLMRRTAVPILAFLFMGMMACARHQVARQPQNRAAQNLQGKIFREAPAEADPNADYLFFLHAKIVEDLGLRPTSPRYGVYEYEEILNAFRDNGFVVISEARPKDTAPEPYVIRLIGQIRVLLHAGVPPQRITVLGASKGAVLAMLVSSQLKNKRVNFVIMSNCNDWVRLNFKIDLHGNVLSIYDINDEFGQSCQPFFEQSTGLNRYREIKLEIGAGHGILFKPLQEWVTPVIEWARQNKQ
jgi:hypothetical protein